MLLTYLQDWLVKLQNTNPAGLGSDRIRLGQFDTVRLSGHGSGRVGLGIGSFSVGSFQVSGHIRSGQVCYRVIYCRVILDFESY
jgi:hypothetical protein